MIFMSKRRSGRVFAEPHRTQLLNAIGDCRNACVSALGRTPIQEELYGNVQALMAAIDRLAETITGDRTHFHLKSAPAPPRDHEN
jgi:hypothetical protein